MSETDARATWIDTVLARAKELRTAGVLSIAIDGCSATLAPADPAPVDLGKIGEPDKSVTADGYLPPLLDPSSYPDGVVPGFQIEKFDLIKE